MWLYKTFLLLLIENVCVFSEFFNYYLQKQKFEDFMQNHIRYVVFFFAIQTIIFSCVQGVTKCFLQSYTTDSS